MSTIHNLVVGALLLGGSILHAQDVTSSTYCEFTGSFSGLCSSDVVQMTAPVVNPSSGTASFSFNISSGIYDDVNYVVPKIEVIASNSKFLDSSIFLDDPKSGVSKFIVENVALQSPTKSAVFTFSSDNRSPYYIFYRLISKSGPAWQNTPWKIYQNGGIPVSICLHDVCGDERLSIKVADNAYINRLSISKDSLLSYDLISDDKTISLSTFSCKSDAVSAATALKSETTSCYADGNRKVFLDISGSEDGLLKRSTKTTSNLGLSKFDAGILYNVLKNKSYVAAVIDQGASIDNLKDLAADLYLRYDNLASLSDILGASRTDGLGISGRNKGWLYPRFIVKNVADNPSAIYPGVAKKITVAYYYDGSLVNASNAALVGRDVFVAGVNTTGGYRLAFLSDDWNLHAINKADFGITTSSDTFVNLQKNGFWAMLDASTKKNGEGSIRIDGNIAVKGGSDVSSFLVEDVTYRSSRYERVSGTPSDRLYFDKMADTLYVHSGAAKRLKFFAMPNPISVSLLHSDPLSKVTKEGVALSGNNLTISVDGSAEKKYYFPLLLKVLYSSDTVLMPILGKVLNGVHYVMVGYDNSRSYYIRVSRSVAVYYAKSLVDSGEEPHFISSYPSKKEEDVPAAGWYYPRVTVDQGDGTVIDYFGITKSQVASCVDGHPFSALGKKSNCGSSNSFDGIGSISGVSYFGHGHDGTGNMMFGYYAHRYAKYNVSDCIRNKDFCWFDMNSVDIENGMGISYELFRRNAKFVAYSCLPGREFSGESLIYRIARDWGIAGYGNYTEIVLSCIGRDFGKKTICNDNEARYFNLTGDYYTLSKEKKKALETKLAALLEESIKNGWKGKLRVKANVWKHVDFNFCDYTSGTLVCHYDGGGGFFPAFLDPIEVGR